MLAAMAENLPANGSLEVDEASIEEDELVES
jgi:hypothetical protein